jgi:two-component system cell cycle response regulator DivK
MPRILYVEDNDENIFMLHRRLTRAGFEVAIARDGEEGLAMAASVQPDLIVMDLDLPVLDGWEATRRLKAGADTKAIPVVALTAHNAPADRERALAAGCDDFQEKPVDFQGLIETIQRVLARRGQA